MKTVVVDDLRLFMDLEATYLRTLSEALYWWEEFRDFHDEPVELWLDHDLGGDDTIRPLVDKIIEHLATVGPLPLTVRIVTDNPVGRRWMQQGLERWVPIVSGVPPWRICGVV